MKFETAEKVIYQGVRFIAPKTKKEAEIFLRERLEPIYSRYGYGRAVYVEETRSIHLYLDAGPEPGKR